MGRREVGEGGGERRGGEGREREGREGKGRGGEGRREERRERRGDVRDAPLYHYTVSPTHQAEHVKNELLSTVQESPWPICVPHCHDNISRQVITMTIM